MKKPLDTIISDRARLRERVRELTDRINQLDAELSVTTGKMRAAEGLSTSYFGMFSRWQNACHSLQKIMQRCPACSQHSESKKWPPSE